MIGGLKFPRAGGIGVNANDAEDLPISLLLSPLTTGVLTKGVDLLVIGCAEIEKGLPFTGN